MDEESNSVHVEQEKTQSKECKEKAYWTLSEKKLFIFFLALHKDLICSKDCQIGKQFWENMAHFIGTNKTPSNCFYYMRQLTNEKKYGDDRKKLIEE